MHILRGGEHSLMPADIFIWSPQRTVYWNLDTYVHVLLPAPQLQLSCHLFFGTTLACSTSHIDSTATCGWSWGTPRLQLRCCRVRTSTASIHESGEYCYRLSLSSHLWDHHVASMNVVEHCMLITCSGKADTRRFTGRSRRPPDMC